jgi:amino-acid N-acetyltransferase
MSLSPLLWSRLSIRTRAGETLVGYDCIPRSTARVLGYEQTYPGQLRATSTARARASTPRQDASREASIPIGQLAKQKEEDKQFFADLLTSAATRRDARAYISRLKKPQISAASITATKSKPSNLFGRSIAVESSPVFQQYAVNTEKPFEEVETPHVALIKVSGLDQIEDDTLRGIAGTLAQLARLSMLPCVVIDAPAARDEKIQNNLATHEADRLVRMLDEVTGREGRKISDILTIGPSGRATLSMPNLLFRPLHRGRIPVVVPIAYDESTQKATSINADEVILALTQYMSQSDQPPKGPEPSDVDYGERALVDRIIVIDPSGGIPSTKSLDQKHVFVNMAQEYHSLQEELRSSTDSRVSLRHASNLAMLNRALDMLPGSASGLITTPQEASNSTPRQHTDLSVSSVGTRRQRNPLIHNLLTDKPAYSSSLPSTRLSTSSATLLTTSTSVKRGMPLTILPNPAAQAWAPNKQPWIKLTDPRIDLPRLVHLINDSFDRTLDVDAYLARVNDSIAGVIIAGDYEGGAILTWERPPGLSADQADPNRLVPYLDKFAVLKRSQGAGGVADIVFNAMVRTCFPDGVCWRSRKDNPVNKWYFERSRGTWKIPGMNWTMFWTTEDVVAAGGDGNEKVKDQRFLDYEAVCRSVKPTWMDGKKVED